MDTGETILLLSVVGLFAYLIGNSQGQKRGFQVAQNHDAQWIRKVSSDNAYMQSENARLAQENGGLRKENGVVENLLRQQPTTPQAEAILKALNRVEMRLTEFLPPQLESGEDHDTSLN